MTIPTRPVLTTQFFPDGRAREGETVRYRLERESYTAGGTVPTGDIYATVGTDGVATADLWPNAEGLTPSHYTYWLPDGNSGTFILPEGDTPISLEELRLAQETIEWYLPTIEDFLEMFRAILASVLGSLYVGWNQIGVGAIVRTVRDRLRDRVSVLDYIPAAEHAAIRAKTSVFDCSPYLMVAWEAMNTAGSGAILDFPAGRYCVVTQALMDGIEGLTLQGGIGTEIYVPDDSVSNPFVLRDCTDITIKGITFRSVRSIFTNAIKIENSSGITVHKCKIFDFLSYGVVIGESSDPLASGTDISFNAATRTLTKASGGITGIAVGDSIRPYGSLRNNVIRKVESFTSTTIVVTEAWEADESAGATTSVFLCKPCNRFKCTDSYFENCGIGGINYFAKVQSYEQWIERNTFVDCNQIDGLPYASAAAVKPSQFVHHAVVRDNYFYGGGSGIGLSQWDTTDVSGNHFIDINSIAIAISASTHRLWSGSVLGPSFQSAVISDNIIEHTQAHAPSTSASAFNINGLLVNTPVIIENNKVIRWKYSAVAIRNSLSKLNGLVIRGNKFRNTGGGIVTVQLTATATATNGSAVLTGVINGSSAPAGWTKETGVSGSGIPAGTTVSLIESISGSFTLSQPAIISDTVTLTNIDGTIESTGTLTFGSPTVTNVTNAVLWTEGDAIFGNGIPEETTVTTITQASTRFTLSNPISGLGVSPSTITITSDAPENMMVDNNEFLHTPIITTGNITNGETSITGVPAAVWSRLTMGTFIVASGVPSSTLIGELVTSGTVPMVNSVGDAVAATATTTGVSIRFATARRSSIQCTNLRFTNNLVDGYGDYALVVGGGATIDNNRWVNCNPQNIANRGPIFLDDALAYDITRNRYDNGTVGNIAWGVNNTNSALVRDEQNICVQSTIRSMLDPTKFTDLATQSAATTRGGKRIWIGTTAPAVAGQTYYVQERVYYPAPVAGGYEGLICVTQGIGAAAVWKEFGRVAP